jgi:hypothetical protein
MKAVFLSVLVLSIALNVMFLAQQRDAGMSTSTQRQLALGMMEQDLNSLVSILYNNDAGHNKAADPVVRKAYERRFIGIGFIYWANAVNSSQIAASPTFEAPFRVHLDIVGSDLKQHMTDPLIIRGGNDGSLHNAVLATWGYDVVPDKIIQTKASYAAAIDAFSKWVQQLRSVPK